MKDRKLTADDVQVMATETVNGERSDPRMYECTMREPNVVIVHRVGSPKSPSSRIVVESALGMSSAFDVDGLPATVLARPESITTGIFLTPAQARAMAETLLSLAEEMDGFAVDAGKLFEEIDQLFSDTRIEGDDDNEKS